MDPQERYICITASDFFSYGVPETERSNNANLVLQIQPPSLDHQLGNTLFLNQLFCCESLYGFFLLARFLRFFLGGLLYTLNLIDRIGLFYVTQNNDCNGLSEEVVTDQSPYLHPLLGNGTEAESNNGKRSISY